MKAFKTRTALLLVWVLCWIAAWAGGLRMAWAIVMNPPHAWDVAKAFDLVGNVAANGTLGEMISARAGRQRQEGRRWACVLCRLLDVVDPGHCDRAMRKGDRP